MNVVLTIIEQFRFECDGWERLLSFFQEENIYLQKRLFEVVRGTHNDAMLQQAECFQTNILEHDDTIKKMKQNIKQQDHSLEQFNLYKIPLLAELMKSQNQLRKDIRKEEWLFTGLQADFNGCVEGLVLTMEDLPLKTG